MSTKQKHLIERQYSSKPGFIRVKLIELDPAPDIPSRSFFSNTNIPTSASSLSSSNSTTQFSNKPFKPNHEAALANAAIASTIDPYCAINIKELILVDEKSNTKPNSRKSSQSQEPSKLNDEVKSHLNQLNQSHTTFTLDLKKSKYFILP